MGILAITLLWDLLYSAIFAIMFFSFIFITKWIYKKKEGKTMKPCGHKKPIKRPPVIEPDTGGLKYPDGRPRKPIGGM